MITNTKLYVTLVTLSIKDKTKFLENVLDLSNIT